MSAHFMLQCSWPYQSTALSRYDAVSRTLGVDMKRREFLGGVVATATWPLVTLAQQSQSQDGPFQFGLIGDMPYTHVQEQQYQRVLAALNNADLAFVVHVGDTQNDPRGYYPNPSVGLLPCTDENY